MHTIILIVLIYAALRATLRKLRAPEPYEMQLVSRPEGLRFAARESRSTNSPNPFSEAIAREITVEEPYQHKRARLELQRKAAGLRALMDYYPVNLETGDLK
jgi:hypothetical protein